MRVNIYEEEITEEIRLVSAVPDGHHNKWFYGVRFYLKSHDDLHHTEKDDDRSAVTFWLGSEKDCKAFFANVHHMLSNF